MINIPDHETIKPLYDIPEYRVANSDAMAVVRLQQDFERASKPLSSDDTKTIFVVSYYVLWNSLTARVEAEEQANEVIKQRLSDSQTSLAEWKEWQSLDGVEKLSGCIARLARNELLRLHGESLSTMYDLAHQLNYIEEAYGKAVETLGKELEPLATKEAA